MTTSKHLDPRQKAFRLRADQIQRLIPNIGGCLATDSIVVDGYPVGFMYREAPNNDIDSGWRFFSGHESQDYLDDANHTAVYNVNTIANYDPTIIPYLQSPIGSAFERSTESGAFTTTSMPGEPEVPQSI